MFMCRIFQCWSYFLWLKQVKWLLIELYFKLFTFLPEYYLSEKSNSQMAILIESFTLENSTSWCYSVHGLSDISLQRCCFKGPRSKSKASQDWRRPMNQWLLHLHTYTKTSSPIYQIWLYIQFRTSPACIS